MITKVTAYCKVRRSEFKFVGYYGRRVAHSLFKVY